MGPYGNAPGQGWDSCQRLCHRAGHIPPRGVTLLEYSQWRCRLSPRPPTSTCRSHSIAQHSTTRHNTTQHNTTQHNTTQHNTAQHSTAQHNTTQHNTTQHNRTEPLPGADVGGRYYHHLGAWRGPGHSRGFAGSADVLLGDPAGGCPGLQDCARVDGGPPTATLAHTGGRGLACGPWKR